MFDSQSRTGVLPVKSPRVLDLVAMTAILLFLGSTPLSANDSVREAFATSPTITVEELPRTVGGPGAFEYVVSFSVPGKHTGWIVQHIDAGNIVKNCDNTTAPANNFTAEYWEAWRVVDGTVYAGATGEPNNYDMFRTIEESQKKWGTIWIDGWVKFLEGYDLTSPPWGRVPEAGDLMAILTEPVGWGESMLGKYHLLSVSFSTCGTTRSEATAWPTTTTLLRRPGATAAAHSSALSSLLLDVVAWTKLRAGDTQGRSALVAAVAGGTKIPLDQLRRDMVGFSRAYGHDLDVMSKLYVLNRVVFDVPESWSLAKSRFFGGWWGVPRTATHVNMLWPLSRDSSGRLVLRGLFRGYAGHRYKAVEEFDYFRQKFGVRTR